jgi:uncharacterized protein YraI
MVKHEVCSMRKFILLWVSLGVSLLLMVGGVLAAPTPSPSAQLATPTFIPTPDGGIGAGATIGLTTTNLRIRSAPTTRAPSLQVIPRNTTILLLGRTADGSWLQVQYKSVIGWVTVFYVASNDDFSLLPVTDATDPNVVPRPEEQVVAPDGTIVKTGELIIFSPSTEVNVRVLPDEAAPLLGRLAPNQRATVRLLDPTRLWGQIDFEGQQGWVALYVVAVYGDIRTVAVLGVPDSGWELPIETSPVFSLEQRQIVANASAHLGRYIGAASDLVGIFSNAVNSGFIACGPVPAFLRPYRPFRTDYARVPELEPIVTNMNLAFDQINFVRAQWLNACAADNTLSKRDSFDDWLATVNAALPVLDQAQRDLATLSAR